MRENALTGEFEKEEVELLYAVSLTVKLRILNALYTKLPRSSMVDASVRFFSLFARASRTIQLSGITVGRVAISLSLSMILNK